MYTLFNKQNCGERSGSVVEYSTWDREVPVTRLSLGAMCCVFEKYTLSSLLRSGLEVIKLEFILRPKIKRNDWLLLDKCPQATNHYVLF